MALDRHMKGQLVALALKGTRPAEHEIEILGRFGFVDARGRVTAVGNAKARELDADYRRSTGDTLAKPASSAPAVSLPRASSGEFRRG